MIQKKDLLIAISKSGESKEIVELLPAIKNLKVKLLSITENSRSSIGSASDSHIEVRVAKEACPNGLAPTSSTTVPLALGDSIAVALLWQGSLVKMILLNLINWKAWQKVNSKNI